LLLLFCHCSAVGVEKLDQYAIIKCPLTTESAMKKIEDNNTLVFLVSLEGGGWEGGAKGRGGGQGRGWRSELKGRGGLSHQ
jgi:hypothetical protein